MKKIVYLLFLFATLNGWGQTYNMPAVSATHTTCSGNFYDSGGAGLTGTARAGNDENATITFCPVTPGDKMQVIFSVFDLDNSFDFLEVFDGATTGATSLGAYTGVVGPGTVQATSGNASGCLTFRFTSDALVRSGGWEAALSCFTPCQTINSVFNSSNPAVSGGVIKICQGQSVQFTGSGTFSGSGAGAVYTWDFGNGTTGNGTTATGTFTAAGSYLVNLDINVAGCTNNNKINQVVQVSTTPSFAGTSAASNTICAGQTTTISGSVTPTPFNLNCTPPVSGTTYLPDGTGTSYSTCIDVNCFGSGQTIASATDIQSICINMEHSYSGDLDIAIQCPNGQTVSLKNYPGGGGTDLGTPFLNGIFDDGVGAGTGAQYCFSMSSSTLLVNAPIVGGSFSAGTYSPAASFGGLIGCPLNGNWCIKVTDHLSQNNGYIFNWDVNFDPSFTPASLSFTPAITSTTWSADATITGTNGNTITVQPFTTGTHCYTFTATDDFNCSYTTTQCITVTPGPTITVNSPTICSGTSTVLTASGGTTYSWTPGTNLSGTTGATVTSNPTTTIVYTVTGTTAGCSGVNASTVTINPIPTTTASTTGTLTCFTTTVALNSTLAGVNYTWTAPAGGSVASANTQSTTASGAAGTYTLLVSNAAGCTYSTTTSVTQNTTVPTTTASTTGTLTCTTSTVALNSTLAGMNYTWTAPAGGSVASANTQSTTASGAAGTYTIRVVNPANGCSYTTTTAVTQNTAVPTTTASTSGTITCSTTTVNLNSTLAGMNYTWTAPGGSSISSGTNSQNAVGSGAGTYSITVSNPTNGCVYSTTTSVSQNTTVPTTTASTTGTLTCTTSTVALNSTLAGMNYTWTAPAGGSVTSANTQSTTASGTTAGVYSLTVVNPANGCSYTTTTSVTQNTTAPTGVNAGSNQTLTCVSASVTLNGSVTTPTNATANWSGANVCGTATNFTTLACGAGVYTLTATSPSNGCVATSTVQVFPSAGAPAVTLNPVTNTITCTNTLVTVSISTTVTPVTYTWSGTGISSGNGTGTITVTQGGTFNYTVTNTSSGCTTAGSQSVVQNTTAPTTTASTTGTLTCSTTTVELNSTLTGMNYTWTAPAGGSVASANTQSTTASGAAGTYTIMVVNPTTGCSYTTTTAVTQNTAVPTTTASVTGTVTCITNTVNLNSTLAGMNYTWTAPSGSSISSGMNSQNAVGSGTGTYSITVSSPVNGCVYSTTTSVTNDLSTPSGVSAGPSVTLSCSSTSVTLNGSFTAPVGTTANWVGGVCGSTSSFTTAACAAGVYTLEAQHPTTGCISTSTVEVFPNAGAPSASISPVTNSITCTNTLVTVSMTSTSSPISVDWSGPSIIGSTTTNTIDVDQGGAYTVTVTNTSNSCTTILNITVPTNTSVITPTINGTATITCSAPSTTLDVTPSGSAYSYVWTGTGIIGSANNSSITVNAGGNYDVTVTETANGCVGTATITVTANGSIPTATITPTSTNSVITCINTTVDLTVNTTPSTGMTYTWSTAANTQTAISNSSGVVTVTVENTSNGCTTTSQFTINSNITQPNVVANNTIIPCSSNSVSLLATSSATNSDFSWVASPGTIISGSNTATPTVGTPGQYIVTVTDNDNGCTNTVTTSVTQTSVNAAFTANPLSGPAPLSVDFTNQSNGATSYTWDFGDTNNNTSSATNPNHMYNTIGNYTVMLVATAGACKDTAYVTIEVIENSVIIIPNVFTPNGDNSNDFFTIKSSGINTLNCNIFNRWGQKMYTITSPGEAWDGKAGGNDVPAGTYFFILKATGYDGKEYEEKGSLNLFR